MELISQRQVTRLQPELVSEEKCSTKPKKSCQLRTDSGESVFNTNEKPLIQRFCLKKQNVNLEELDKVSTLNLDYDISNSVEKFEPLPLERARMLTSNVYSTGVNNVAQLDGKKGFTESRSVTDLEGSSSDHDLKLGLEKENFVTYPREMQLGLGFPSEETTSNDYLYFEETTMPSVENQENMMMMYETTAANTIIPENSTPQEDIVQEVSDTWNNSEEHESSTELSVSYSESSSEERHLFSFLPNSTSASK